MLSDLSQRELATFLKFKNDFETKKKNKKEEKFDFEVRKKLSATEPSLRKYFKDLAFNNSRINNTPYSLISGP